MAEYIKIVGDQGNTIIDDNFRNLHFIASFQRLGSSADQIVGSNRDTSWYPPIFGCRMFRFQIASVSRPVVALNGGALYGIQTVNTGGNAWTVTVWTHDQASVGFGNPNTAMYTFYFFGTTENYTKVTGRPVIEVFNAAGALVFSSALKPLRVVDFYSGDPRVQVPNFYNMQSSGEMARPIPNFDPSKKYAIIMVSPGRTSYNWGAGGLVQAFQTFTYLSTNNNGNTYSGSYVISGTQSQGETYEVFVPAMSFMVIDVTGY